MHTNQLSQAYSNILSCKLRMEGTTKSHNVAMNNLSLGFIILEIDTSKPLWGRFHKVQCLIFTMQLFACKAIQF